MDADTITFFDGLVEAEEEPTRETRESHDLKLPPAAKFTRNLEEVGAWGSREGSRSSPLAVVLKVLGPAVKLSKAARELTLLKWQPTDAAVNRAVGVLSANGVFDKQVATFAALKERYAAFFESAGATPPVLRDLTFDASDFFETAAPAEKLPGGSAPHWGLGLTYGDAEAFGIAPDATTAEHVFDFVYTLGPMYVEKHFASSGSVQLALKKYKEVHASEEANGDEIAITIIDGLGTCSAPPGFDTVELNIPRRRLAIGARFNARNGTPEQVKQLLAKYLKSILSLYPTLEKGFAGADASDVVDMAMELAASLDCASKPLTGLFERLNRTMRADMTPPPRSANQSAQEWSEGIMATMRSRKRSLSDAPTAGDATKAPRADGSSSAGVPRSFMPKLHTLLSTHEWRQLQTLLIGYHVKMQVGASNFTQVGLLEAMLTSKLPQEAWPLDASEQPVEPELNRTATPFSICQQFLRGKYDPAVVVPDLFFLKPVCNERTFAKLLAQTAVRALWRSGSSVPACLQNASLDRLACVLMGKRWQTELDIPNMLNLVITCIYNDTLPIGAVDPYKDLWLITNCAEPASEVMALLGFSNMDRSFYLLRDNATQISMLNAGVPGEVSAVLALNVEAYIKSSLGEANQAYIDIVDNDNPWQTLKTELSENGGAAERQLTLCLANSERSAEQRRASSSMMVDKMPLKLQKLELPTMVAPGANMAQLAKRIDGQQLRTQLAAASTQAPGRQVLFEDGLDPGLWITVRQNDQTQLHCNVLALQRLYVTASSAKGVNWSDKFALGEPFCVEFVHDNSSCTASNGKTPCGHSAIHRKIKALTPFVDKLSIARCFKAGSF